MGLTTVEGAVTSTDKDGMVLNVETYFLINLKKFRCKFRCKEVYIRLCLTQEGSEVV